MPAAAQQLKTSETIIKNISFADYSPHPINVNQFFSIIPINTPPNFNAVEVILTTHSFTNLFAQNVGFYRRLPNDNIVTMTDVVAGMPSTFFVGIPVPSSEKITLGIPTAGMSDINGSTIANPDAITIYPYFGFGFNARSFAVPVTHSLQMILFVANLVPSFIINMDIAITYFRK